MALLDKTASADEFLDEMASHLSDMAKQVQQAEDAVGHLVAMSKQISPDLSASLQNMDRISQKMAQLAWCLGSAAGEVEWKTEAPDALESARLLDDFKGKPKGPETPRDAVSGTLDLF